MWQLNPHVTPFMFETISTIKQRRLELVERMLIDHNPPRTIIQRVRAEFDVTERTVRRDIAEVRGKWATGVNITQSHVLRGEAIEKGEKVYKLCLAAKRYGEALRALMWLGELQGLRQQARIIEKHIERDTTWTKEQVEEIRFKVYGITPEEFSN